MAISVDTIRRLTEFVWLDACSLASSGLYEGKAGHALCLFEMARYFRDDALEERAFGCLQEALVCRAEAVDCGFGLSGIGSVFLYLIRYSFVENDFQSLFGGQQKKIYAAIGQAGDKAGFIELLPFLTACRWLDPADAEPARLSAAILNDSFGSVEKTFAPDRWHCEGEKEHWLSFLGTLLRSMFVLERQGVAVAYDRALLGRAAAELRLLTQSGRLRLPAATSFYIGNLPQLSDFEGERPIVIDPVASATSDLAALIRLNVLQSLPGGAFLWADNPLAGLSDAEVEPMLMFRIGHNRRMGSFYGGIARFLLYYLYAQGADRGDGSNRLFYLLA